MSLCTVADIVGPGNCGGRLAFKFSQAAKDGEHQVAMRGGSIGPGVTQGSKASSRKRLILNGLPEGVEGKVIAEIQIFEDKVEFLRLLENYTL